MAELGWSKSDALVSGGRWGMKKAVRLTRVSASQESGKERLFIRDRRRQELDADWRKEVKLGGGIIYFKSILPYSLQQTKTQGYDFSSHNPAPNPLFLAHCCPSVCSMASSSTASVIRILSCCSTILLRWPAFWGPIWPHSW